jgi:hypothetical protein
MVTSLAAWSLISPTALAQANAAIIPKPVFEDGEPPLSSEFNFDLPRSAVFAREYPPGSKHIATPPATISAEFQIEEPRPHERFWPYVGFFLTDADQMRMARVAFLDAPGIDIMTMTMIAGARVPGGNLAILRDEYTRARDGAIVHVDLTVGRNGWIRIEAAGDKFEQQLDFVPARFGAGALGARGWLRFREQPIA